MACNNLIRASVLPSVNSQTQALTDLIACGVLWCPLPQRGYSVTNFGISANHWELVVGKAGKTGRSSHVTLDWNSRNSAGFALLVLQSLAWYETYYALCARGLGGGGDSALTTDLGWLPVIGGGLGKTRQTIVSPFPAPLPNPNMSQIYLLRNVWFISF